MKRKFVGIENLTSKALKRLPDNKILEYIEMHILIGDTVLNYASSEKTLQKYFEISYKI